MKCRKQVKAANNVRRQPRPHTRRVHYEMEKVKLVKKKGEQKTMHSILCWQVEVGIRCSSTDYRLIGICYNYRVDYPMLLVLHQPFAFIFDIHSEFLA